MHILKSKALFANLNSDCSRDDKRSSCQNELVIDQNIKPMLPSSKMPKDEVEDNKFTRILHSSKTSFLIRRLTVQFLNY